MATLVSIRFNPVIKSFYAIAKMIFAIAENLILDIQDNRYLWCISSSFEYG